MRLAAELGRWLISFMDLLPSARGLPGIISGHVPPAPLSIPPGVQPSGLDSRPKMQRETMVLFSGVRQHKYLTVLGFLIRGR